MILYKILWLTHILDLSAVPELFQGSLAILNTVMGPHHAPKHSQNLIVQRLILGLFALVLFCRLLLKK